MLSRLTEGRFMTTKDILMPFAIFVCFSLVMSCTPQKPPPAPKPAPLTRATTYDPCFIYPQDRDHFAVSCVWPGIDLDMLLVTRCLRNGGLDAGFSNREGKNLITYSSISGSADKDEAIKIANLFRRCIEASE